MPANREEELMDTTVPFDQAMVREVLGQIGKMNVLAISGGRVHLDKVRGDASAHEIVLPVAYGYSVVVMLDAMDTYIVERRFTRGQKVWVKRRWTDVYCDQVGEIAYLASCYRDGIED